MEVFIAHLRRLLSTAAQSGKEFKIPRRRRRRHRSGEWQLWAAAAAAADFEPAPAPTADSIALATYVNAYARDIAWRTRCDYHMRRAISLLLLPVLTVCALFWFLFK